MKQYARIIEHGIVLQDFSGIHEPEEGLSAIAQARAFMETQPQGEVLLLTDATGSVFNQDIAEAMRELAEHHKPWVRASVVIGLSPLMRLFFRAVVAATGRDIRALDSRTAAIAYLVARRAKLSAPSTAAGASRRKP